MVSKRLLYGIRICPAVRAAHMTLEALAVDYEYKLVDIAAGETRTPEYLKKNPQHTVPVFEETDGKCIWDSHAIMAYLVRRYGKDDSLYPKDFYERAVVDQRLHYENGTIFSGVIKQHFGPFIYGKIGKEAMPEIVKAVEEVYEMLEIFLGNNSYMAGKSLTIADFSIVSTVSSISLLVPVEAKKYPKLSAWFESMKKLPYYERCNAEGLKIAKEKIQAQLDK